MNKKLSKITESCNELFKSINELVKTTNKIEGFYLFIKSTTNPDPIKVEVLNLKKAI